MNITRIFGQIKSLLYVGSDPVGPTNPIPVSVDNQITQPTTPTDIQPVEFIPLLRSILTAIANPPYVDKSANQMRSQVTGSITTVTTVTTVTGLTNIDSYQGKLLIINQNINAWANCVRANIT